MNVDLPIPLDACADAFLESVALVTAQASPMLLPWLRGMRPVLYVELVYIIPDNIQAAWERHDLGEFTDWLVRFEETFLDAAQMHRDAKELGDG